MQIKFRAIRQIFMEILRLKELGDTESVVTTHECSLGLYLVIENFLYVPSDALPKYKILKQLAMEILHFEDLGDT